MIGCQQSSSKFFKISTGKNGMKKDTKKTNGTSTGSQQGNYSLLYLTCTIHFCVPFFTSLESISSWLQSRLVKLLPSIWLANKQDVLESITGWRSVKDYLSIDLKNFNKIVFWHFFFVFQTNHGRIPGRQVISEIDPLPKNGCSMHEG